MFGEILFSLHFVSQGVCVSVYNCHITSRALMCYIIVFDEGGPEYSRSIVEPLYFETQWTNNFFDSSFSNLEG